MSKIWSFMLIISIVFAVFTSSADNITGYITKASANSIENILTLAGMVCFWTGIFNIIKHTSIIDKLSKVIKPIFSKLLKKEEVNDEIMENVALNVTSNMLGVGNAATVFGIEAIKGMQKLNIKKDRPNDTMSTFILLNTASMQLIPTTMISLRIMYSSSNPSSIILPVWIVSITSQIVGLITIKLLNKVLK